MPLPSPPHTNATETETYEFTLSLSVSSERGKNSKKMSYSTVKPIDEVVDFVCCLMGCWYIFWHLRVRKRARLLLCVGNREQEGPVTQQHAVELQ